MLSRRIVALAISLTATAAVLAPSAASASVQGTSAWRESGARDLGSLPARPMTITFALAPRHGAGLQALVSAPHSAITPAQFTSRFGPSKKTVKRIRKWANGHELTVTSVSPSRMLVRLSGSSTSVAHALHTSFHSFSSPATGTFFQIAREARLPKAFARELSAVLGLSNLTNVSLPHPAERTTFGLSKVLGSATSLLPRLGLSVPSLSYPAAYGPKDFWSIYDAPSSETAPASSSRSSPRAM